jgi:large subunit ribosomal protein L35
MSKLKTRKAAAKRFKQTGSGKKIMRRKAFRNHLLEKKTTKRKRKLGQKTTVDKRDETNVRLMVPYM